VPTRIAELAQAVTSNRRFEKWQPTATPESLEDLGRWFETQVETRTKAAEEIAGTRAKLRFPIDVPGEDLTDRTFSVAMDIGIYFAQVVLKNMPGVRWDQPLGNKKFADYGQPVLMGFGTIPLNPIRVIVTTAYAIARKKPAKLRDLFDTWSRMKRSAT
jgi:hypothetical protein